MKSIETKIVDHQLFSSLNEQQKIILEYSIEIGYLLPRKYLFKNDKRLKHIYFIKQGKLLVGKNLGLRNESISFLGMKPMFIGLESLMLPANNKFVKTLSHVHYARIDAKLFLQLLMESNGFHNVVRKQIAERLNEMDEKYVRRHSNVKLLDRLKFFFAEILEKNKGRSRDENRIEIHITHFEIGQYLQCSRQSVSHFMSNIRKEGIIDYDRNWIRINDLQKLLKWEIDERSFFSSEIA